MRFSEIQNIPNHRPLKRRASEGTQPPAPATSSDDNEVESSDYWRRMFMSLQSERTTAAETQLYVFMEESKKREDALLTYIRHVESDLDKAKEALKISEGQSQDIIELQERHKGLEEEVRGKNEEIERLASSQKARDEGMVQLQSELRNLQRNLDIYHMLTGTAIDFDGTSIDCKVVNSEMGMETRFRLTETNSGATSNPTNGDASNDTTSDEATTDDEKMASIWKYEPVGNVRPLPSFLRSAIEFERSQCPPLMQNVLKGMFPED